MRFFDFQDKYIIFSSGEGDNPENKDDTGEKEVKNSFEKLNQSFFNNVSEDEKKQETVGSLEEKTEKETGDSRFSDLNKVFMNKSEDELEEKAKESGAKEPVKEREAGESVFSELNRSFDRQSEPTREENRKKDERTGDEISSIDELNKRFIFIDRESEHTREESKKKDERTAENASTMDELNKRFNEEKKHVTTVTKPKRKHGWIAAAAAVLVLASGAAVMFFGKHEGSYTPGVAYPEETNHVYSSDEDQSNTIGNYTPEKLVPDVDEYFSQNGTVINKINAAESKDVHTEKEISVSFSDRGFNQFPITTDFSIDGTLIEETEISAGSNIKHPIYTTYYVTSNGSIWTIIEINGVIVANPASYNLQSNSGVELVISESNSVMSYDYEANLFYETNPKESVLLVKTVDRIDAETLEKLTAEGLGA